MYKHLFGLPLFTSLLSKYQQPTSISESLLLWSSFKDRVSDWHRYLLALALIELSVMSYGQTQPYYPPEAKNPQNQTYVNGTWYYTANHLEVCISRADGPYGDCVTYRYYFDLWRSNGTAIGTTMIKRYEYDKVLESGWAALPNAFVAVGNSLFFVGIRSYSSYLLTKIDNGATQPVEVRWIRTAAGLPSDVNNYKYNFTAVNNTLFFTSDEANGMELWKSDGTAAGTVLVKDIYPGAQGAYPANLRSENGLLYFTANDGNGYREWQSDGTVQGTQPINVTLGDSRVLYEYWQNIPGTAVSNIPVNTPATLTGKLAVYNGLETNSNQGDNYGERIRAYLHVASSGSYLFYIAGDDNCELWLSTDETPAKKVKLAYISGTGSASWAGIRQWTKFTTQKSLPVTLQAGKTYYLEVLHKEGIGGDNLAVGWTLPGTTTIDVIPGNVLSPYIINQAPQVSLTFPANNSVFMAPASINLNATASDADGSISKVEFYNGTTKLGEDLTSPYNFTWNNVAQGNYNLTAKAIDNLGAITTSATVSVAVSSLPSPWRNQDIGDVGLVGSANYVNGTFTVKAAGYSFWLPPDNFHYVYQPISGDATIIAEVNSIQNTSANAQAGLMMRESLTASTSFVATVVNPTGTLLMSRQGTGNPAYVGRTGSAPIWLKLVRSGNSFTSFYSIEGVNWTSLGTVNITMPTTIYVGLAVTSANTSLLNTSTFSNVSVSATHPLPQVSLTAPANNSIFMAPAAINLTASASNVNGSISKVEFYNGPTKLGEDLSSPYSFAWNNVGQGTYSLTAKAIDNLGAITTSSVVTVVVNSIPSPWKNQDIGAVGLAGSANYVNGSFTVKGAGYSFWIPPDNFHYVYQPISGNATIIAKVVNSLDPANGSGEQAGLMMRESLTVSTSFVATVVNPTGTLLMSRQGTGTPAFVGRNGSAPIWLKLVRSGNNFTSSYSLDGVTWTTLGSVSITMSNTIDIGLAVTSGNTSLLSTSTFSNVSVSTTNQAPQVSLSAPAYNASFIVPATVNLTASASDADGSVSKVEFYNGAIKLGEDMSSPYSFTWSNVQAGSYSLTAKAIDNLGNITTSAAVAITVTSSCTASGSILREYWANIAGAAVSAIPITTMPTSTSQITIFETPSNIGSSYGQRIRGYLCAPTNGSYTFYIAGDDNCELWLSTDETPAKKVKMAYIAGTGSGSWAGVRQWTKFPTQKSLPVSLVAGKKYYIEALHKEDVGGDNLAVGWTLPGATTIDVIPGSVLSPYTPATARLAVHEEVQPKTELYPNPFSDKLYLRTAQQGTLQLSLLDNLGRVVYTASKQGQGVDLELDLSAVPLKAGMYLLQVQSQDGTRQVFRVIKQ